MASTVTRAVGAPAERVEGREKVTGAARYAYEHPVEDVAYGWLVQSTIARGAIAAVDAARGARAARRARRARPRRTRRGCAATTTASSRCCSRRDVAYRGQIVAVVVAETLEAAREAAGARARRVRRRGRTTSCCAPTTRASTRPTTVNPSFADRHRAGRRRRRARGRRRSRVDATYTTPAAHNNPMEPHATIAALGGRRRSTLYDSTQGAPRARDDARAGLRARARAGARDLASTSAAASAPRARRGRTRCSRRWRAQVAGAPGQARAHAASRCSRSPATARRRSSALRLGADARRPADRDRPRRRRADLDRRASSPSRPRVATRMMYAAPNRRTTHRLARARRADAVVDARAGRVPGHVRARVGDGRARRSRCGIDPIELRIRNEPDGRPRERHAVQLAQPRRVPARGRRALRLGRARPDARRAPRRPLAGRHRRRRLDLPGATAAPVAGARPARGRRRLRRRDRRRRHRHRRAHRAHPDRRRRARRRPPSSVARRDRRQRAAARAASPAARWAPRRGARRCHGACRDAARPTAARRRPSPTPPSDVEAAREQFARHAFGAQFAEVARRRRHRRGPRAAAARRVRRRPDHQPDARPARSSSAA